MFPKLDINYILATDFDQTWFNFELDLPLEPGAEGQDNPFYVARPGNPTVELEQALLLPFRQPPKYYFSGHRGCGKSTELRRIAVNPQIRAKFWPVHFSIRDESDINDLDAKDILLAIGGKMFRTYRAEGGKLPKQLLEELDSWRGEVETEIKTVLSGRYGGLELDGGLDAFFATMAIKMKLEPTTRQEIRQVFQRDITGLIKVINDITVAIQSKEKRLPLILIDDLDKATLERSRQIFYDNRQTMEQPNCALVYTVSNTLFYSVEFEAIRDRAIFLPNIKVHDQGQPRKRDEEGFQTMRAFVQQRMDNSLISKTALDTAVGYSGGVFREMARLIRTGASLARRRPAEKQIQKQDIEQAANEIRNEYRRILDSPDLEFLKQVGQNNQMQNHERLRPLLQLLAILEYRNGENWCDIHPVLRKLVDGQPT